MRNSTVASWLSQMLVGFALVIGGLETAWIFRAGLLGAVIGGFAAALLGLLVLGYAEARRRPHRVIHRAQRSLELARRWGVEYDKVVPGAGTMPIVVTRSDSTRFAIDIKGYKDAATKRDLTGKEPPRLIGPNGKPFRPDPLPRLAKAAAALGATPVLWLPEADTHRNLRLHGTGLIVVMGSARHLKHALIGAEVDSPRHAPPQLPSIRLRRKKKPRPMAADAKARAELATSEVR